MNAFMYSEGTEPVMLLVGLVVLVSMVYWSYVQYVYCGTHIQSAIFLSLSTTLAERQMTQTAGLPHYHLNEAAVLLLMLARRSRVKHYKGPCKLILLLATVSHHIHYYYCSSLQSTAQQQKKKTKFWSMRTVRSFRGIRFYIMNEIGILQGRRMHHCSFAQDRRHAINMYGCDGDNDDASVVLGSVVCTPQQRSTFLLIC